MLRMRRLHILAELISFTFHFICILLASCLGDAYSVHSIHTLHSDVALLPIYWFVFVEGSLVYELHYATPTK